MDALIENDIPVTQQIPIFTPNISGMHQYNDELTLVMSVGAPGLLRVPPGCKCGQFPGTVRN